MNVGFTSATGNMGKTTILLNLLISLLEDFNQESINCIDGDERQTSLSDIMNLRKKNGLSHTNLISKNDEIIESLNNKKILNLVDLKGHLGEKEALILKKLDLIIIITSNDKMSVTKTLKYIKIFDELGLKYKVLCNQFNKDVGLDYNTLKSLFNENLLESVINNRDSYKNFYSDGSIEYDRFLNGVFGLFRTKKEIDSLKNEMINCLNKK